VATVVHNNHYLLGSEKVRGDHMARVTKGLILSGWLLAALLYASTAATKEEPASWDPKAAATYLDARQAWWFSFPSAARDHDTACVSCHTTLPYALARPALRALSNERRRSPVEAKLIDQVSRRVRAWKDVAPWYPDQTRGLPKTAESRGTESILNALILARRDGADGTLSDDTRLAFSNLWAQQMRTGELTGAWAWLYFRLEPWEGAESAYFGATLAAFAVGTAPNGYAASADIQDNLKLLRGYLAKQLDRQPTFNRLMLLWASANLTGLITPEQREGLVAEALAKQQHDGGWSLSSLGPWQRADGSAIDTRSDGYGTGLATFALQQAGVRSTNPRVEKALQWLFQHQDPATGRWFAPSLNKQRDPESDAGRFMSDVATAYAVLALTEAR
jgi:squalene-hopene/tetraprenyl-beta-curcumene cyclase